MVASYQLSMLISGLAVIGISQLYIRVKRLYSSLGVRVDRRTLTTKDLKKAHQSGELQSLPKDLMENLNAYKIIYEVDEHPSTCLAFPAKDNLEHVFTLLLRRNICLFARFPQSWMLWFVAKGHKQRQSFSQAHIRSLEFREGDLFCGFYHVVKRTTSRMEVKIELPGKGTPMGGMLFISLRPEGSGTVMSTETLQWTTAKSGAVLPLERRPLRFMHEMASWWLLVTGVEYLKKISSAT